MTRYRQVCQRAGSYQYISTGGGAGGVMSDGSGIGIWPVAAVVADAVLRPHAVAAAAVARQVAAVAVVPSVVVFPSPAPVSLLVV